MPGQFYEIIFETGNHAIAYYEDEAEAQSAVKAHNDRAIAGEPAQESNPLMGPAERVNKVLIYNEHPADYNAAQTLGVDEMKADMTAAIDGAAVGDLVSVPEVADAVRNLTNPFLPESGPHESSYKMESVGELTGWEGDTSAA